MIDAGTDILGVATVIAFTVLTLVVAELLALGTLEFGLRKTMLTGTFDHTDGSDNTTQDVLLFTADGECESLLGTTEEEIAHTGRSTLVGWHGLLFQF